MTLPLMRPRLIRPCHHWFPRSKPTGRAISLVAFCSTRQDDLRAFNRVLGMAEIAHIDEFIPRPLQEDEIHRRRHLPIAAIVLPLAGRRIDESFGSGSALDIPGIALVTSSALGWGLMRGNSAGWSSFEVVTTLGSGMMLAAAFVRWELRARVTERKLGAKYNSVSTEAPKMTASAIPHLPAVSRDARQTVRRGHPIAIRRPTWSMRWWRVSRRAGRGGPRWR